MSNQTNSCHTLSPCRCSKTNDWTCQEKNKTKQKKKHRNWNYCEESQAAAATNAETTFSVETRNNGVLGVSSSLLLFRTHRDILVARKHFIWFFILLITAGSVAHLLCFRFISNLRLLYRFARRSCVFATVGFHEVPACCCLTSHCSFYGTSFCSAYFSEDVLLRSQIVWF